MSDTRYLLTEADLPKDWYNIAPDLPAPLPPPLHPGTGQPIGPADLAPLFPMEVIKQEVSQERYIPIPEEVRDVYRLWRPTPLYRARRLEQALELPDNVRIFYKYEGVSPAGSHKPNTAVPQAYYNKQEGVTRIATETGAGQWGSSLAMACAFFGIELKVYMVKISYAQKPYRRALMETWGATCVPSPSPDTARRPRHPGAGPGLDRLARHRHLRGGRGRRHPRRHQVLARQRPQPRPDAPDRHRPGGAQAARDGRRLAGRRRRLRRRRLQLRRSGPSRSSARSSPARTVRIVAAEPAACPSLTKGVYAYDFGDTAMMTPLVKMHTLGHSFVPAGIHAGGLRYHGMAPLVSHLSSTA